MKSNEGGAAARSINEPSGERVCEGSQGIAGLSQAGAHGRLEREKTAKKKANDAIVARMPTTLGGCELGQTAGESPRRAWAWREPEVLRRRPAATAGRWVVGGRRERKGK